MRLALTFFLCALTFFAPVAQAGERETIGVSRLFTNDYLGDGQDRWRTGAYAMSWMRAAPGTVSLPDGIGEVIEYRFGNQMLAPANITAPAPGDRRYAGILTFGAYTHFKRGGAEYTLGAEAVAVGPMTRVIDFHSAMHTALGMPAPSAATRRAQFGNAVHGAASFEAARPMRFGTSAVLRPFVQGRAGDETFVRAGVDLLLGGNFTAGILARDATTGLLYQTIPDAPRPGVSFLLGADTAHVFSSAWLPEPAYRLTPLRHRLRGGLQLQHEALGLFTGLTWSGREFAAQPEGQLLGSLQLDLRF